MTYTAPNTYTTMRQAVPEPAPALELTEATTIAELCAALNGALEADGLRHLIDESEGLRPFPSSLRFRRPIRGAKPIPKAEHITPDTTIRSLGARWLICYAVPGSNEGYYLTLAAVIQPSATRNNMASELHDAFRPLERRGACVSVHLILASGKTFAGMREAAEVAARVTELIERWDW